MLGAMHLFLRDQRGVVAVLVAIVIALLIGVGALAVDLPRVYSFDIDLQNIADAAALAGARELDGQTGAIARATDAARYAVTNAAKFASTSVDPNTFGIQFLASIPTLDTQPLTDFTTSDSAASYILVTVPQATIGFLFASVTGAGQQGKFAASAVAGNTQIICQTVPMFMCNPTEPPGNTDPSYPVDYSAATDLRHRLIESFQAGGSTAYSGGNFGLLCPAGSENQAGHCGAQNLPAEFASRSGTCIQVRSVTVSTKTGADMGKVTSGLNARMDSWDSTMKSSIGDPNYEPSPNVTQGAVIKTQGPTCQRVAASNFGGGQNGTKVEDGFLTDSASGFPAGDKNNDINNIDPCILTNTCSYISANGTADGNVGSNSYDWYTKYFDINQNTAFPPNGWPGTNPPSRYEVYRWELENSKIVTANTSITSGAFSGDTTLETGTVAASACWGAVPSSDGYNYFSDGIGVNTLKDRRIMPIAIVNCGADQLNNGVTTFTPSEYDFVFVAGQVPTMGNNKGLFIEMEGKLDNAAQSTISHDIVQLYRRE